ncbi:hypothetical protein [Stenotrophomonas sp. BIGb0135]|uniref:hypothetical protein n=1 Tax=Stenotrophomonas sp. BIGb0135 TaxID=2940620 RepID=UPI002168FEE8|nr:hypothetical protein [Stenotrophomonas sp. BIGb0135]MCS4235037.1 hypothetical protein [Stenotrophomonas sp. BIGb0135]MCS4235092.1 hypothetical protein [Stenotrophomonas sp. BIGb0135]
MRPDQKKRLAEVSEKLAEVAINDADPANWTGDGKLLSQMTKEERGDAAWCRKTAVQSVALLGRLQQLLRDDTAGKGGNDPDPEDDIRRAEQEAAKMLKRVGAKSHGAA